MAPAIVASRAKVLDPVEQATDHPAGMRRTSSRRRIVECAACCPPLGASCDAAVGTPGCGPLGWSPDREETTMTVRTAEAPPRGAQRYQLDPGVGRLTPAESAARGKTARAEVPRDSHAMFDPPPNRPDPIGLLEEQGKSRVPELVPVRYGRMMVSPFTYFRGAALPMASDLAGTP